MNATRSGAVPITRSAGRAQLHRRALRGALVSVLWLSAGCAARQTPVSRPLISGPLPTSETLTSAWQHQREARTSLRTLARMAFDGPDERGHARQVLLVVRPARVRVEVLSPLGTVFVLTADDGALAAYARSEATLYRGHASRANLQRYARVNLELTDAVDLLLGTPPPRQGRNDVVSFDPESASIQLWRELPSGAQVVWFNGALQPVATEERDGDGQVRWRARFADFASEHADMPQHIEIDVPREGRHVSLDLQDIEVNPTLADSWFTLATPAGTTEIQLDGGGADS